LLIEAGAAVMSGISSTLPKILVLVLGCLVYAKPRLLRRTFTFAVVAAAVAILSVPIARAARSGWHGQGTWDLLADSVENTWGTSADTGWEIFSDLMVVRQSEIAQTPALIMYKTPDMIPYLSWQDLAVAPLTFIPRVVWPSKPVYGDTLMVLTTKYFNRPSLRSASAATIAGNAYMYGGWPVVVIAMFSLGIVTALAYRYLALPGLQHNQVGLLAVYAGVVIANFHIGEVDFVSLWQGLVQRTAVFLLIAVLLCRRKSTTR
jgi:hypothetical protein